MATVQGLPKVKMLLLQQISSDGKVSLICIKQFLVAEHKLKSPELKALAKDPHFVKAHLISIVAKDNVPGTIESFLSYLTKY